jgi:hypothetical protein
MRERDVIRLKNKIAVDKTVQISYKRFNNMYMPMI